MSTRKRKSPRHSYPREGSDPQQTALYAWEEDWYDWRFNTITLKACRDIARKVCAAYEVPVPKILSSRSETAGCYCRDGEANLIVLQSAGLMHATKGSRRHGALNLASILHELAHHIICVRHPKAQDHGPTFLGVYLYLLVDGIVAPRSAIYASAREFGLRWSGGAPVIGWKGRRRGAASPTA